MKIKLEPLPFDQAIEYFRDKVALTPKQFKALELKYRDLAFTISGITALDIVNDISKELLKAIEEGLTQQEFGSRANDILERRGWKGLTPFRVDNIFRTNVQTAYMAGHYERMTDPDVAERRPYWMYDAVLDRRTRPTHQAMDGMVFRYDHPFWDTWYPPNGYRCRCSVRTLSERDVRRRGIKVEETAPSMVEVPGQMARQLLPDRGFDHNPAKARWEPDMSKYPKPLVKAYRKRAET